MPTNHYDAIVLGDDLAGLLAATLCARRGLRVLVTETEATHPSEYRLGPYTLPRRLLPFVGESSPAVRRVVAELHFIQLLRRRLTPLRPSFQIVLPDARLEVASEGDGFTRALARELPGEREAVEGFLARAAEVSRVLEPVLGQDVSFPPDGFWEKREIGRNETRLPGAEDDLLPGVPAGHRARALVSLPAAFTLPCDPRALTPTAAARAFDLWRRGAARFEGGDDALRDLLLDKLRTQHAGEVRVVRPVALPTRWGRATGVELAERNELLGSGHLIAAGPIGDLLRLFGGKPPRRLAQLARALRPTAHRFLVNVVLSAAGVPEGISAVTFVVFDPAADLVGDNAFAIHLGEPDDDGRVVASLVANAVCAEGEAPAATIAALVPRLLARLEEIMPFSGEHILQVHCPSLPPEREGAPAATPPEPLWTPSLPLSLGVGALSYDTGVKGVTSACAQNLLGLGLEGSFAAGWCAARIISSAAGKKKDFLKDEALSS